MKQDHHEWLKTFCQVCLAHNHTDGAYCVCCHAKLVQRLHEHYERPGTGQDHPSWSDEIATPPKIGAKAKAFTGIRTARHIPRNPPLQETRPAAKV